MPGPSDLFLDLTPDRVLAAVEAGGLATTGLCYPLNSFENRVYEVELADGSRVVAKFYRPRRWSREEILEEHSLLSALDAAEVPVTTVREFPDGGTLANVDGIQYALSDRRGGRAPDELTDELAHRLGMLVGRLHNVAAGRSSRRRPLDAETYALAPLAWLRERRVLPAGLESRYARAVEAVAAVAAERLRGVDTHVVHADLHLGNLLERDGRLVLLDFDDLCRGPAVQDLWLLLPGRGEASRRLRALFLDGYEQFRAFDRSSLRLIEPLRGLRMIRYAAWLARRWNDPAFRAGWPQFGTADWWREETEALEAQVQAIAAGDDNLPVTGAVGAMAAQPEAELTNKDFFWDWEED